MKLLAAACLLVALIAGAQDRADKSAAVADEQFKKEWSEVKSKYPAVAMAYARRNAFVIAAGTTKDICSLYRVLGLAPPRGCGIDFRPIGNIGDCFKPNKTADKSVEMPDADQAQACVNSALKLKRVIG